MGAWHSRFPIREADYALLSVSEEAYGDWGIPGVLSCVPHDRIVAVAAVDVGPVPFRVGAIHLDHISEAVRLEQSQMWWSFLEKKQAEGRWSGQVGERNVWPWEA